MQFTHLRVASAYSLQYGPATPEQLVARAAELEMPALALTDRDGILGAVRFVTACAQAGLRPIVGVDLALEFASENKAMPAVRSAARGGSSEEVWRARMTGADRLVGLPRVSVLARPGGWGALCRLISEVHATSPRQRVVASPEIIARHAAGGRLVVVLGADSELGMAAVADEPARATAELRRWAHLLDPGSLAVAVTDHLVGRGLPGSTLQAGRMIRLADAHRVPVVLTNQVRMIDPSQAPVCDILDSARRLMPLDLRVVERANAEGWLKPADQMAVLAEQVSTAGARRDGGALLETTASLAESCHLDPVDDIGLGRLQLPGFAQLQIAPGSARETLSRRCREAIPVRYGSHPGPEVERRLEQELDAIATLGYEPYFLTVAKVVDMVRGMGVRCAARGSGAGSLVNHLLGISGVDPIGNGLLMERFLSPLRAGLPDIDLDVESARREEIYRELGKVFGAESMGCVAMVETYRVRHAVRDVGRGLGIPPGEVDAIAKAFPHIRARDVNRALAELPELRGRGLERHARSGMFDLVAALDGLPRHVALHPCGVILSDPGLGDRVPLVPSAQGHPMCQFDKDDVEALGLLKLDVLGVRMQSALAHGLDEVERTTAHRPDIDSLAPFDDPEVYSMIDHAQTLGCFQIESPGQRELVGKFGPQTFNDIVIDISLFRPGPVKSDMVTPFLDARQGWVPAQRWHPQIDGFLAETMGVVIFHEQIIEIIAAATGCSRAMADVVRRRLGDRDQIQAVRTWFVSRALLRGWRLRTVTRVWDTLANFASFGFCKAHAAAFALPTYQSAWLKVHHPAAFIAGLLSHDPGMYPKRLIVAEAVRMGVRVQGLDVNASRRLARVEAVSPDPDFTPPPGLPNGSGWAIRLGLAELAGIDEATITSIETGQPFTSLTDFWQRSGASAPVIEALVRVGAFDSLYGIDIVAGTSASGVRRRDLLLRCADLTRLGRSDRRVGGSSPLPLDTEGEESDEEGIEGSGGPGDVVITGLPEMDRDQVVRAELEILGMDVSAHVIDGYREFLRALGATTSAELLDHRNGSELFVAGIKVATQTPGVRSGRRVVFCTLDDGTGPLDATFFPDVQEACATTVFSSWLLVVRGHLRRTGPRGVSLRATGAWDLVVLAARWQDLRDQGWSAVAAAQRVRDSLGAPVLDRGTNPAPELWADLGTAGEQATRKLWHTSQGSPG